MLLSILKTTHNTTTLLFGIFISAFFLGMKKNVKNMLTLTLFFVVSGLLYLAFFLLFGENATTQAYPLLIHLPLVVFLICYYKYRVVSATTAVFSAYLCCQISNWIGLVTLDITGQMEWYYVSRIFATLLVFYVLSTKISRTMEVLLSKDSREVFLIGLLPFVYYVFDYVSTKFSDILYSGNKAVTEFMSFAFCLSYLIFLLFYIREYERKLEIRQYSDLMEVQLESIHKEIEHVNDSKKKLTIMKHDMRHHLHIIHTFLQENRVDRALDYIKEADLEYEDTHLTTYCKNELLNSIISLYDTKFSDRDFTLKCTVKTGAQLPCPDITLCTVLSNALENAMHALENMQRDDKWAELNICTKGHHLLLELRNPVEKIPTFIDGIPVSTRKGHGIGVKSIIYYVEQMNGQYEFAVTDHTFVLRIIVGDYYENCYL